VCPGPGNPSESKRFKSITNLPLLDLLFPSFSPHPTQETSLPQSFFTKQTRPTQSFIHS
jgi:hypothetical protein